MVHASRGRIVLAFDLDNTLLNELDALVAWHNRVYGTELTRADYVDHYLEAVWGTDRAETSRRAEAFHASEEYKAVVPIDGVAEALRLFQDLGCENHVVTGRPEPTRAKTHRQVDRFFPGLIADVHICNSYRSELRVSKAVICLRIGAKLIADDVHEHAQECVDAGITALLIDFEWNRHHAVLPERMHRIKHVSEVERYLR